MPRSSLSSPFCPSRNSAKEHGCRIDFRLKSCQRRRQAAHFYKRRRTLRWFWDDVFRANVAYGSNSEVESHSRRVRSVVSVKKGRGSLAVALPRYQPPTASQSVLNGALTY